MKQRALGLGLLAGLASFAAFGGAAALPDNVDPQRAIRYDATLGLPRIVWGVAARAPMPVDRTRLAMKSAALEALARRHLEKLAPLYRLDEAALAGVVAIDVDTRRVPRLVRYEQRFDGVPVVHRELVIALDGAGELIMATGSLSPHRPARGFALDASSALAGAWRERAGAALPGGARRARADGWEDYVPDAQDARGWRLSQPARLRRVYHATADALSPAWQIELVTRDVEDREAAFEYLIDATDGRVLGKRSLISDAAHQYRVWAATASPQQPMDGAHGDGLWPHPTGMPDGTAPVAVARNLVTVDSTVYRPTRPWFDQANSSTFLGTRVQAYADVDGGGASTCQSCSLTNVGADATGGAFDFPWDPALAADASLDQVRATLVHGFYVANHIADWFYLGGFDEAGGNHQVSNFGLGGQGGDPLDLQTLDGDVTNNANAFVPADGQSPRIQMGRFIGDAARSLDVTGDQGFALALDTDDVGSATFGDDDYDFSAELVVARDDAGVDPLDLCEPPVNAADFAGKIAVVRRGNCFFADKAFAVQEAGAIGMLATNHLPASDPAGGVFQMGGATNDVTIAAMLVSLEDGTLIRDALAAGEALEAHLVREALPAFDSTADSSVIAHEWGHVLVNRNVNTVFSGCDINCSGPQPQGFNEGTADFVALLYLVDAEAGANAYQGTYGIGAWVNGRLATNGAYFGWRRYPYSTDMTKSPLTFQHLGADSTLPAGIPSGDPNDPVEVHAVGEIWAAALWEGYAGMLRSGRYTYDQARDRMRDYLVTALKAMPDDPTFLEARDVVYAAVLAESHDDHALFAAGFAKRGMGQGAVGPSVDDTENSGIVESFVVEPTPEESGSGGGGGGAPAPWLLALLAAALARRRLN